MNSPGKASPHTRIRARLSQTQRRATTAWTLARGHSFPAMARNSARPVSKPGSLSPRRKRRAPTSGSVKARPVCVNRPHSNERFAYDDYKTDLDRPSRLHKKARPLDRKISAETRRLSCQGVGLGCLADATLAFGRLCRVPAFLHCGCWLMLQKNPETESVRN